MKRVLKKIKVFLTQLLSFILTFFKDTNLVYVKKVTVKKKIVDPEKIEKKEEKKEVITGVADSTPLPDEAGVLEDKHKVIEEKKIEIEEKPSNNDIEVEKEKHIINDEKLNYKQSIANVSDDIKDKVVNKIKGKEIYFSELIVLNTIVEVLEEKNEFKYEDLDDNKKNKVKTVIEELNNKISPSLKKEMNNNKIKTKEDLKDRIKLKVSEYTKYSKRIKDIVTVKDKVIDKKVGIAEVTTEVVTEPTKIIEISTEVVTEPVVIQTVKKTEVEDKGLISIKRIDTDIVVDEDKDDLISIEKVDPNKETLITIEKDLDPSDDLISIVKADKVEPKEKVYFIADLLSTRRDMNVKDLVKTSTNNTIVNDVKKEIAENMQDKSKKLPFVMVPTEETTKEEIEEKIKSVEITPTLIVEDEKEEDLYRALDEDIDKEIQEEQTETLIEVINNKEKIEKDIEKLQENLIKISELKGEVANTEKKVFDESNNIMDDEPLIGVIKKDRIFDEDSEKDVDSLKDEADVVIKETSEEIEKENLEDKDYDKCEKQIDKLLAEIDEFIASNRLKLSEKDIKNIKSIKKSLLDIKNRMNSQKETDIENEKKELEDKINEEEIQKLEQEIKKLHLEHQAEIDDDILKKLKEMEESNDPKLEEFETALVKKKLKRASKLLELPTLLALPFVRNKYFLYFTAGMLINNHFDFISAIFRRKEKRYEAIDLTPIKNGKNALEESLDITYRNIMYLDMLEEEALAKYPNLINDKEFTAYIDKIRTKLNKNYERLEKKQKMVEKYIYKVNKKNKVLKKYKLLKDKNAA